MVDLSGSYKETSAKEHGSDALAFHDLLGNEFTGETAQDIVNSLYSQSLKGVPEQSFEDWAAYQKNLFPGADTNAVHDLKTEADSQKFLEILLECGGIEAGPLPKNEKKTISNKGMEFE